MCQPFSLTPVYPYLKVVQSPEVIYTSVTYEQDDFGQIDKHLFAMGKSICFTTLCQNDKYEHALDIY